MGVKSAETALNKERVYNFIRDNPHTSTMKIAKAFGFTKSQTDYYVRPMVATGVLIKTLEHNKVGKLTSYTIGKKSFVRTVKTVEEAIDEDVMAQVANMPREIQGVARLIKLSNRHMQPPRSRKARRSGVGSGLQSSMGMFNDV